MNKKYLNSKKNLIFADLCGAEFVMNVVIKKKTEDAIILQKVWKSRE